MSLKRQAPKLIEAIIFQSRWLLVPMYLGLSVALGCYVYKFLGLLWKLISTAATMEDSELLLTCLGMVDYVMIGNLIVMISIGSFSIFVHKLVFTDSANKPQWLDHMNSSRLKVKMGMSLIGVTAIHLLQDFVNALHQKWDRDALITMAVRITIFVLFIISTVALAYIDKITHPTNENHETVPATARVASGHSGV